MAIPPWSSAGLPPGNSVFDKAVRDSLRRLEGTTNALVPTVTDLEQQGSINILSYANGFDIEDGTTGAEDAIQAALDAAEGGPDKRVLVPNPRVRYKVRKPIYIPGGVEFGGVTRTDGTTMFDAGMACGPMFVMVPDTSIFTGGYPGPRTVASVIGATAGIDFMAENDTRGYDTGGVDRPFWYISLDDAFSSMRLHGRTQLRVRFHLKLDVLSNGGVIIASGGARSPDETANCAFEIKALEAVAGLNKLRLKIKTTTTTLEVTSASAVFVVGTFVNIEFHWDGTTARVWADGVNIISAACGGSIVQSIYETFCLTRYIRHSWEFGSDTYPCCGIYESFDIGSAALRTTDAGFTTPTTPYTTNGTTLALFNGETDGRGCLIARNSSNEAMYFMTRNTIQFGIMTPCYVHDLSMHGGSQDMCLFESHSVGSLVERCDFRFGSPDCVHRWAENFETRYNDCHFVEGVRVSWMNLSNSGFAPMYGNVVVDGQFGCVEVGGTSLQHFGLLHYPTPDTIFSHMLITGNGGGMYGCTIDQESDVAEWEAGLFIADIRNCTIKGGGMIARDKPSILFGTRCYAIHIDTIEVSDDGPEVFSFLDPAAQVHPIHVTTPQQGGYGTSNPEIPWSLDPELVVVVRDGQSKQGMKDLGNSGTALTLLGYPSPKQKVTMTGNCTFTVTLIDGERIELHVLTGAGGFTGTFTGVTWVGGSAPTITAGATKLDIVELWVTNATKKYGRIVGQNLTP